MGRIIESVPNVSEGRRQDVVEALVASVRETPGVRVLDAQSDKDHNRSVLSLAGDAAGLKQALLNLFEAAVRLIDLRGHRGGHPRLGAVDVVPFIPIEGVTMAECVALAKDVAQAVSQRYGVPTYLYEEASSAPHRRNLEDIRRGEFEGLGTKMQDAAWKPDFGPTEPHVSAGASVIGARMPLIAFNINLSTSDVSVARAIAKGIRHSSGGYRFVKAMGLRLEERNIAQVSMNLTDFKKTPLHRVFETVRSEAARHGVSIVGSEVVGLVPNQALVDAADHFLRLENFKDDQILEQKLRDAE